MRNQIIWVILLFVLLTASWFLLFGNTQHYDSQQEAEQKLMADYDIALLKRLAIKSSNAVLFDAVLDNGAWQASHLDSKSRYPAAQQQVNLFVQSLFDAIKLEKKTSNPANFYRLGLRDIDEDISQSRAIELEFENSSVTLLMGNPAKLQAGQYVRWQSDNQTYLIDSTVYPPDSEFEWLEPRIFKFESQDINTISRATIGSDATQTTELNIINTPEGFEFNDAELQGLPKRYEQVLSDFASDISELEILSVRPKSTNPTTNQSTELGSLVLDAEAQASAGDQDLESSESKSKTETFTHLQLTVKAQNAVVDGGLESFDLTVYKEVGDDGEELYWLGVQSLLPSSVYQNWEFEITSLEAQALAQNIEDFVVTD